jgi:hypothetical protein
MQVQPLLLDLRVKKSNSAQLEFSEFWLTRRFLASNEPNPRILLSGESENPNTTILRILRTAYLKFCGRTEFFTGEINGLTYFPDLLKAFDALNS